MTVVGAYRTSRRNADAIDATRFKQQRGTRTDDETATEDALDPPVAWADHVPTLRQYPERRPTVPTVQRVASTSCSSLVSSQGCSGAYRQDLLVRLDPPIEETWPRVYESTLVPLALLQTQDDPVHLRCIGPFLEQAARELEHEQYMRCICRQAWCATRQITLRAWHLYWASERAAGRIK